MTPQTNRSTTAEIIRYGAYLPRYRAPLGEIQKFYGRPGRPRAKALCTPALDEDPLTMAYEAAAAALEGAEPPGTVIAVSQSPPFGLRKLSATLARALGLPEAVPLDVGGHPGRPSMPLALAGGADRRRRAARAGGRLRPPGQPRRARRRHALGRRGGGLPGGRLGGLRPPGALGAREPRGLRRLAPGHRARAALPPRGALRRLRVDDRPGAGGAGGRHRAAHLGLRGGLRQPAPPPDAARRWAGPA